MLHRQAAQVVQEKAKQYPVIAITGPRQSGKSTLSKMLFPRKAYCNLEAPDNRQFALEDPRRFLAQYPQGAILDEIQHCPELFSYIQVIVDEKKQPGQFILTGSQQFGLQQKISQSLAGRAGYLQLLPFTLHELQSNNLAPDNLDTLLFNGLYPPLYDRKIQPKFWFSDYIMTYLERDVRQQLNIQNLTTFQRFLQLCAARTGQLLNLSSLANDCGVTHNTAKSWLSVLEASYVLYLLPPHHKNFNKRLMKAPKLYFYDTGIAAQLLGIQSPQQIATHPLRGELFETWVVGEFIKNRFNQGLLSNLYFWREHHGHEIDLLIEQGNKLIPIEIKSGQTLTSDYFKQIDYWHRVSQSGEEAWLIYGGQDSQHRKKVRAVGWADINGVIIDVNSPN